MVMIIFPDVSLDWFIHYLLYPSEPVVRLKGRMFTHFIVHKHLWNAIVIHRYDLCG
jgi:hypothetical protein